VAPRNQSKIWFSKNMGKILPSGAQEMSIISCGILEWNMYCKPKSVSGRAAVPEFEYLREFASKFENNPLMTNG
jgi:hypothetical protein